MAVGDTIVVDGVEYEVVWNGGEGLVSDRETKIIGTWTPPTRIYNKTGKHAKKVRKSDPCPMCGARHSHKPCGNIEETENAKGN